MRLIALEESFSLPTLASRFPGMLDLGPIRVSSEFVHHVAERLPELAGMRLADMDANGVDVQVLSLTAPGVQAAALAPSDATGIAREANDALAETVRRRPDRFVGLAAVGLQDPRAAVTEARRSIGELGMRGVLVNDHTDGRYLDDPAFEPFWDVLEELDVPLYIHPGAPTREQWALADGAPELIGPLFTWGAETGGHALRLIFGGVFDRHPSARVILGHMGEYLPFMMSRLDSRYATLDSGRRIRRMPSEYLGRNIHITTSGVPSPAALTGAIHAIGADAIMFAIDYPWEDTASAVAAFQSAPLAADERELISYRNAERLLRL
ncbi:amidohydrolase family protein [Humibacter albus]|uniref:amidohydrolase family protein n=1 Tax=Humibacter albus TaxID=427754 RepID=UPI0003B77A65|nr:amidohydrolase family protein [Humibacter albus]